MLLVDLLLKAAVALESAATEETVDPAAWMKDIGHGGEIAEFLFLACDFAKAGWDVTDQIADDKTFATWKELQSHYLALEVF